jgi:glycosyltransferase involved in cell wall biosynthesis
MKILIAARFLPHPEVRDTGGQSVFHAIEWLSRRHDVSLLAFTLPGEEDAVRAMGEFCDQVVSVPYRPGALPARLWRASWRMLLPKVYGRNVSLAYWRALRRLLAGAQFDVLYLDGMMALYRLALPETRRVLDEIDIYSQVAKQTYLNQKGGLSRLLSYLEYRRTLCFELALARRFEGVVVRSAKDGRWLRRFAGVESSYVVPPWFEGLEILKGVDPARPAGDNILFVGAMGHMKNVAAITYFVDDILPLIRQEIPDVHLYIVGANPAEAILAMGRAPGITVTGEVDDLAPYFQSSAVNIVPLLHGGGLIAKTLNGMAAGRPTVTTPLGNSGTGAKAGRDLVVVHGGAEDFAAAVIALLQDDELWRRMAANGKVFASRTFDWDRVMAGFEGFLEAL